MYQSVFSSCSAELVDRQKVAVRGDEARIEADVERGEIGDAAGLEGIAKGAVVERREARRLCGRDFALDGGVLHGEKAALREHEGHSHPGENVRGLLGLEPVSEVPDIVVDLHSDARIEHEPRSPSSQMPNAGRGCDAPDRQVEVDHHSPLN